MPTFGFSAFLKLICLNDRPQRTQLRQRLQAGGGGYDFHRSLRLRAQRFLVDGESMKDVAGSIREIVRAPEQNSARIGLERLEIWRRANPGAVIPFAPVTYESPARLFKVIFAPDFGVCLDRHTVAVHVWNTAWPDLSARMVYAALSLFLPIYFAGEGVPDDLAVLSLPEQRLYRLSDADRHAEIGVTLATRIENLLREVGDDIGLSRAEENRGRRRGPPSDPPGPERRL
jgi:hypothetical protein